MTARWPARLALAAALSVLPLTGCQFQGVYDLPLPGKVGDSADAPRVTADFDDALDLVPAAAVKANQVTVGHVERIELHEGHARVVCRLAPGTRLPANAVARIEQVSLLGEKFVAFGPPPAGGHGVLADGAHLPLARSSEAATVEEVLSALSLLLNGGGLEQLATITRELNAALGGREDRARSLLTQLRVFTAGLDGQRTQLVRALTGVERLAGTLRTQRPTLERALDQIPPALAILAEERTRLTRTLTAVDRFGTVATRVVNTSRADLVANLRSLQPTLRELAAAGSDIPRSLETLLTVLPPNAEDFLRGGYGNGFVTIDLTTRTLAHNLFSDLPAGGALAARPRPGSVAGLLLGGAR